MGASSGREIQVDAGNFTRIHNTILERMAQADLNGSEFRCLMYLFRRTYGFNKKEDTLAFSQWVEGTGLEKRQLIRTVQGLVDAGYIYAIDNGNNRPKTYGFNKYLWDAQTSGEIVTSSAQGGGEIVTTSSGEFATTSSGEIVTSSPKTSGEIVTHKRHKNKDTKKDKENNLLPVTEKESTEQQQWFAAVCWLVHKHRDYSLLSAKDKTAIGDAIKDIRESKENYTLDDLRRWYVEKWSQTWPGKQQGKSEIQKPTLKQIKIGIGEIRQAPPPSGIDTGGSQNGKAPHANSRSANSHYDFLAAPA